MMKRKSMMSLTCLLAMGLLASCGKEGGDGENYTERAFGMKMDMVYVEGGSFEMGATSEQGENVHEDEFPVHEVRLDSYYIGAYEVTQAQWECVMETTLDDQRDQSYDYGFAGVGTDYPMYYVNWHEAKEFCDKLSKMTGKKYRLPTEAEWEYAARGGVHKTATMYAGSNDIDEVAWYGENGGITLGSDHPDYGTPRGTHRVGTKKANALGIYDMSGNVWEWCFDRYDADYYKESVKENPIGATRGVIRVQRGGGWPQDAEGCRVSIRYSEHPGERSHLTGFRVVCEL